MVTKLDRLLANMSKWCENRTIMITSILLVCGCCNSICSKTLQCMGLEVGSGHTIFGVLITLNTTTSFAFLGSTFEVMILASILIPNVNWSLEEAIDQGMPVFLQMRLLSAWVGLKAPTESWGFSEELTERAWLQLVRSCTLHTCCCPNFWKARVTGCRCSEEYHEDKNGAPKSSKMSWGRKEWE